MQKSAALGATGTNPVKCDSHIKFEAGVLVFCRHSFVIVATAAQAVNELQRRWIDGSNPCMPHETDDVDDDLLHR